MSFRLRQVVEKENHPEVLKEFSLLMCDHVERLEHRIGEFEARQNQDEQLRLNVEATLVKLRKIIFGKKSEKRKWRITREREKKKEDLLLHTQSIVPEPKDEEVAKLDSEEVHHTLGKADLLDIAKQYGCKNPKSSDWEEIKGLTEVTKEITVIERKLIEKRHIQHKYRFVNVQKKKDHDLKKELIVTAPAPLKLLPGCRYSIDFALSVLSDKYEFHLPLERQRRRFQAQGLEVSGKTLYNLCLITATHLERVYEGIRGDILGLGYAVGHCCPTIR